MVLAQVRRIVWRLSLYLHEGSGCATNDWTNGQIEHGYGRGDVGRAIREEGATAGRAFPLHDKKFRPALRVSDGILRLRFWHVHDMYDADTTTIGSGVGKGTIRSPVLATLAIFEVLHCTRAPSTATLSSTDLRSLRSSSEGLEYRPESATKYMVAHDWLLDPVLAPELLLRMPSRLMERDLLK